MYVRLSPFLVFISDRKPRQLFLRLCWNQKRALSRKPSDKQILRIQIAVGCTFYHKQTLREIPIGQFRAKSWIFRYIYERCVFRLINFWYSKFEYTSTWYRRFRIVFDYVYLIVYCYSTIIILLFELIWFFFLNRIGILIVRRKYIIQNVTINV